MKQRLLIVANRLPVRFEEHKDGLRIVESEGGLATGLSSLEAGYETEWIGWPGIGSSAGNREFINTNLPEKYHAVHLTDEEVDLYYNGFSNETLWPLFHYFGKYTQYKNESWEAYRSVNEKFCERVVQIARKGDIIWVQDYHLMLLPGMLKKVLGTDNPIGFFLHIPFVSYELFRTLPWRTNLMEGLLGADLVGFHTFEYMRHYIDTAWRVMGCDSKLGAVNVDGRLSYAGTFPMGIDYEKFSQAARSETTTRQLEAFDRAFGDVKIILSVDRLDYTKGITNRLKAFDQLLRNHPELKGSVSMLMITVPSRGNVDEYRHLKEEVDELVGSINGQHATLTWTPVHYFYRSICFDELVALYSHAHIALVTPLRDGMNLVAKEYVACKHRQAGTLILSEMAGAAVELDGALRINPNNPDEMEQALYNAIHMDTQEQEQRMKKMQRQVKLNSVDRWGQDFIHQLNAIYDQSQKSERITLDKTRTGEIASHFATSKKRIVFLDYDGTLMHFKDDPRDAAPNEKTRRLLRELGKKATVVLISGRDHFTMEEWFGNLGIELIAEHGIWHKEHGEWRQVRELSSAWKSDIYPVLETFVENTAGASIEEKPFSLAFHYRRTDCWLAEIRVPQLISSLNAACLPLGLHIVEGNKVIEIRIPGIDKGNASAKWLREDDWSFIMAVGDDRTDEDMFAVMPEDAYTIKVGSQPSRATSRVPNCDAVYDLLNQMIDKARDYQTYSLMTKATRRQAVARVSG